MINKSKSKNQKSKLSQENPEEEVLFVSLRADNWDAFYGQENIKKALQVAIKAANKRKESIEHILLYGPPGSGKTVTIQKIIEIVVDRDGVVLMEPSPEHLSDFVRGIKDIEKGREILVVWEDIDEWLKEYESEILSLLDGEDKVDNIVFLSTTNYIDDIPDRIKNRPSRFASVVKIELPNAKARKLFLQSKLHEDDKYVIDKWVSLTEGFSIDHLKDLIITVLCVGHPLDDAIIKIGSMKALSSEKKSSKKIIDYDEEDDVHMDAEDYDEDDDYEDSEY